MTSLFGSDQAYQAMANDFLSLSLDRSDRLFGTSFASVNGQGPLDHGVNYAQFVSTQKIVDGEENNPRIVSDYIQKVKQLQQTVDGLQGNFPTSTDEPSIYDLLSTFPELEWIKSLVDAGNYAQELNGEHKLTFIAPTNEILKNSVNTWLKVKGFSPYSEPANFHQPVQPYKTKYIPSELGLPDWHYIRELLKAHTLRYVLRPDDIFNRKLEVYTAHENFNFIADGTGRIKPELNFYQRPVYTLNYEYPVPTDRFTVKKIFDGKNGVLYVIDGMFSPLN